VPIRTWIAVDHELDSWFVNRTGVNTRPMLTRAILDVPNIGVVMRARDVVELGLHLSESICIGLPDIHDSADVASCLESVRGTPSIDGLPVKAGIECGSSHIGVTLLRELLCGAQDLSVRWILEPYCRDVKCLWNMFNAMQDHGCGAYWKLPVGDEFAYSDYQSIFHNAWLLRSDGVPWDDFMVALGAASSRGCSGVMVGRAFWTDLVNMQFCCLASEIGQRVVDIEEKLGVDGDAVGFGQ
jgi:hypothetical protein